MPQLMPEPRDDNISTSGPVVQLGVRSHLIIERAQWSASTLGLTGSQGGQYSGGQRNGCFANAFVLPDFHGWTAGALWQDCALAVRHLRDIERLAIGGESKWEKVMVAFWKPFITVQVHDFDHTKSAEAQNGLAAL